MRGNLSAAPPRRDGGGMAAYDRLPPPLRGWLCRAALPWSPDSALRIWRRHGGDPARALTALCRAEAATLAREARRNRAAHGALAGHDPRPGPPPPA